ncbi:MAG: hypothetical protein ACFHWZ_06480 [Phycisphaerales bacterium]
MNEIELIGSRCGSISGAVRALEQRRVDVASLITSRFAFENGAKAIEAASSAEQIKVLIDF